MTRNEDIERNGQCMQYPSICVRILGRLEVGLVGLVGLAHVGSFRDRPLAPIDERGLGQIAPWSFPLPRDCLIAFHGTQLLTMLVEFHIDFFL